MANETPASTLPTHGWTIQRIRELTQAKFGKRACWYQVKTVLAIYEGKDVVGCASTGAGKTMSFWIPLLMAQEDGRDKMIFVVTPLNLLGKQNVQILEKAGLPAIAVSKQNATKNTFKDIEDGKYRVVVVNPEILMGNDDMEALWKQPHVTKKILSFVFDEGHCISQWNKFRKEYLRLGNLRYLIPEKIPFYVVSATLPPPILLEIVDILKLRPKETVHIIYSNDRPEIRLMVRGLIYAASSFQDLAFLIPPDYQEGDPPVPSFLVFFDNTKEAEKACKYLRTLLPRSLWHKVRWFHSMMTEYFRENQVEAMRTGDVWGLCCTDAFGMGMDLSNISVVVQWKATCDMCSLWQRFGRGARGDNQRAIAILLVEKKDTEEERKLRENKAARRSGKTKEGVGTKRKADTDLIDCNPRPSKRPALQDQGQNGNLPEIETTVNRVVSLSDLKEERRALYREGAVVETKKKTKGKARELEVVMDDYINATHIGFSCRRIVPTLNFENDKTPTDHHLLCDPTNEAGCTRCRPRPCEICCDLCSPEHFETYQIITPATPAKMPGKSALKPYEPTAQGKKFKHALIKWRQEKGLIKFPAATIQTLGIRIFMPEQVLNRIVTCAHYSKISTPDDILRETEWMRDRVTEYGEDMVRLIHSHYPPIPASGPEDSTEQPTAASRKRAPVKCSACKEVGHNSSNRLCPKRSESSRARKHNVENIPPARAPENHPAPERHGPQYPPRLFHGLYIPPQMQYYPTAYYYRPAAPGPFPPPDPSRPL